MTASLIGSIVERKPKAPSPFKSQSNPDPQTGFPAVQHRSKSAFARARDAIRSTPSLSSKGGNVPAVKASQESTPHTGQPTPAHDGTTASMPSIVDNDANWREQISRENEKRIGQMSEAEVERERDELLGRFGPGLTDLLAQVQQRRAKHPLGPDLRTQSETAAKDRLQGTTSGVGPPPVREPEPVKPIATPVARVPQPIHTSIETHAPEPLKSPLLKGGLSRSSTPKSNQKLRFSSGPAEVHVYESQPSSPRRPLALLPPPDPLNPAENTIDVSHQFAAPQQPKPEGEAAAAAAAAVAEAEAEGAKEDEEGSPEYIRKRYFPSAPSDNPALEWMRSPQPVGSVQPTTDSNPSVNRYDLQGNRIHADEQTSLPTHLGLHHHGGDQAGYTTEELLLLARSSVPAQRASILGVLTKVLSQLLIQAEVDANETAEIADLRLKAFGAGVEALSERGSVGIRAVELVWTTLVAWDRRKLDASGYQEGSIWLQEEDDSGVFTQVPLPSLLNLINTHLQPKSQTLPPTSLSQLLQILLRISVHSPSTASEVMKAPELLSATIQTFISLPLAPSQSDERVQPDPLAIRLFAALASSSRAEAKSLIDHGIPDTFLRFIAVFPSASQLPRSLSLSLVIETLRLYRALARYGLYAHIATIAAESFTNLTRFILAQVESDADADVAEEVLLLGEAWVSLMEVWITCAVDPHRTTPTHDILWSQIVGWNWVSDILALREMLLPNAQGRPSTRSLIAAIWNAAAAWVEGATVNGARSGQAEKADLLARIRPTVHGEAELLQADCRELWSLLGQDSMATSFIGSLSQLCQHLHAMVRVVNASCSDPLSPISEDQTHVENAMSITSLYPLCLAITNHSLWGQLLDYGQSRPADYVALRPVTSFLGAMLVYMRQSQSLPVEDWIANSIRTMSCLLPGDAELGVQIVSMLKDTITRDLVSGDWGWPVPEEIWTKGGMELLVPFLVNAIQPTRPEINDAEVEGDSDPTPRIAPLQTTPNAISSSTSLVIPPLQSLRQHKREGLPLRGDWMFSPLNDLLRSGTSPVFNTPSRGWEASETDIVRATMLFIKVAMRAMSNSNHTGHPDRRGGGCVISREQCVFGCMKVFMLEHGQGNGTASLEDSSNEVFRDNTVSKFMLDILSQFKLSNSPSRTDTDTASPAPVQPTLESIAIPFLGSSTPFFQFYSDFLALYDSISFGHAIFASLLIPPLSMRYAVDYRKLLWGDYNHVLRSLAVDTPDVIGSCPDEWLYPVETDGELLGLYLKALGAGRVQGFLRWIAIHHISCNIWPDLGQPPSNAPVLNDNPVGRNRQTKILAALFSNADLDSVRSVVLYDQPQDSGRLRLPPDCFDLRAERRRIRLESISHWEEGQFKQRTRALLQQ